MRDWKQPKENSIEALQHGIQFGDGVEFDIRVDGDGELVIFHDEFAPGESPMLDRCVENLPTDYLKSVGIPTLSELLSNREFTDSWQSGGKTVDIESAVNTVTSAEPTFAPSSVFKTLPAGGSWQTRPVEFCLR